jgi:hypothetical protein
MPKEVQQGAGPLRKPSLSEVDRVNIKYRPADCQKNGLERARCQIVLHRYCFMLVVS